MTYATDLTAVSTHKVGFTLFVDGVPLLFGTRAGLVYPTSGGITNPPSGTLTSNDGIVKGSLSLEGQALNYETLMVHPTSASLRLRLSSTWDTYFRRRDNLGVYLLADVTETATGISVSSTSGMSVDDPIYINRETMRITNVNSSTSLDVARNYCALSANSRGGHAHKAGAIVSKQPRFHIGRMCELRAFMGEPESTSGTSSVVTKILSLAASPTYDIEAVAWVLSFHDAMRLFDRKVAVGFRGSTVDGLDVVTSGGQSKYALTLGESREFATSTEDGHLVLQYEDGTYQVAKIDAYDSGRPVVQHVTGSPVSARRCYVFRGSPMQMALRVLMSDRGLGSASGTNHATYDTLFGITSTGASATRRLETGEAECRFGAAIPATMIDVTGLTAASLLNENVQGFTYFLGVKGEDDLLSILEEVAWALRGFWYFTDDGKLSFKRFVGALTGATTTTINASDWQKNSSLTSVDDESEIVHTITIKCNHDPNEDKLRGEVNLFYSEQKETHRDIDGKVTIERKGLYATLPGQNQDVLYTFGGVVPSRTNVQAIQAHADRIFALRARGIRKYTLRLPWEFSTLKPGDRVSVTSDKHIAFDGNTLSSTVLEVVSVALRPLDPGPVEVHLRDTWPSRRLNPTAKVSSRSGFDVTLATGSKWEASPGTSPGTWFAVGWKVRVYDYSASPRYSQVLDTTVSAVTATVLTLASITFADFSLVATNDIVTADTYADSDNTTTNGQNSLGQRDYLFLSDANMLLASDAAHQYG